MRGRLAGGLAVAAMLFGPGAVGGGASPGRRAAFAGQPAAVQPAVAQPADPTGVRRVALPDVSRLHPSVQRQIRDAHRSLLAAVRDPDRSTVLRSDAFGAMGTLFMAAEFPVEAEQCLLNAQVLAPGDFRWPYYLGHLHQRTGALAKAIERFERAVELRPAAAAARVWLIRAHLGLGRPASAAAHVREALDRHPGVPAVRIEAGRAALALRDDAGAVAHLTAALAMDPEATVIHYPLAMAHRRLGNLDQTRYHLARRGGRASGGAEAGVPARLPDPLLAALRGRLRNPQAYRDRAFQAAATGDWPEAVARFREAVEAAPDYAAMRLNLGSALERTGDASGARAQFEAAIRLDPRAARAHYSLGLLLERAGQDEAAVEGFTTAVARRPSFVAAHLSLADALRRTGRVERALAHYRRVIALEPADAEARFGEAMALVRLERYREARDRLSAAMAVHPARPEFAHALARVLAAAPDDGVRDGARAWELAEGLAREQQNSAIAETLAMAAAELGRFDAAVGWQQLAMSIARRAERPDIARRMASNLGLYEQRRACRTPWRDDDPDHRPGPPVDPALLDPATPPVR